MRSKKIIFVAAFLISIPIAFWGTIYLSFWILCPCEFPPIGATFYIPINIILSTIIIYNALGILTGLLNNKLALFDIFAAIVNIILSFILTPFLFKNGTGDLLLFGPNLISIALIAIYYLYVRKLLHKNSEIIQ